MWDNFFSKKLFKNYDTYRSSIDIAVDGVIHNIIKHERTKIRKLNTSKVLENTVTAGVKIEIVRIENRNYQFLYQEGSDTYHFMNQKNSLGLNSCFLDIDDPIHLFHEWMEEAKKTEPNDPNAVALATSDKNNIPSVRMVLLKDFNKDGFVFYTNLNSQKGNELKKNPQNDIINQFDEYYNYAIHRAVTGPSFEKSFLTH